MSVLPSHFFCAWRLFSFGASRSYLAYSSPSRLPLIRVNRELLPGRSLRYRCPGREDAARQVGRRAAMAGPLKRGNRNSDNCVERTRKNSPLTQSVRSITMRSIKMPTSMLSRDHRLVGVAADRCLCAAAGIFFWHQKSCCR